jgi:sigma-E factor negative regulatory protein RseC
MIQKGRIKKIDGDNAIVSIKRQSMCGENCKGCSSSCNVPEMDIRADAIPSIDVGDEVEISSEDISVLKYSFVLYGVPLLIMVIVIFLVSYLIKGEDGQIYAALIGLLSLIVSFFILKKYDKIESSKKNFKYTIIKKIED